MRYIDDAVMRQVSAAFTDTPAAGEFPAVLSVNWDDAIDEEEGRTAKRWWYLTDVQFSVVGLIDPTWGSMVVERVEYSPYGVPLYQPATDFDGDGDVDTADEFAYLDAWYAQFGGSGIGPGPASADRDRSGAVDVGDLFDFLDAWFADFPVGGPGAPEGWISRKEVPPSMGVQDGPLGPDNPVGYCGYIHNNETGDYTVRFRHYSPRLGRWLEKDTARYADSMNSTNYAKGRPTSLQDPSGLISEGHDVISELDEQIGKLCGEKPRTYYECMAISADNRVIQSIDEMFDYMSCLMDCIKEDPSRLIKIAEAVGWNFVKDGFEDAMGLPGALIALIQFEKVGDSLSDSIALDSENLAELIAEGFEKGGCKLEKAVTHASKRLASVDESFMRTLRQWAKSQGKEQKQLLSILDAWKKNSCGRKAVALQRYAEQARYATKLARGAKSATKALGKINGIITTAMLMADAIKQLREECKGKCGCGPGQNTQSNDTQAK